jgi:hypothetical protein
MTNKACNLEVYRNGILSKIYYQPTIKKANEEKKQIKEKMLPEERLLTKFKIKKI